MATNNPYGGLGGLAGSLYDDPYGTDMKQRMHEQMIRPMQGQYVMTSTTAITGTVDAQQVKAPEPKPNRNLLLLEDV